MKRKKIIVTSAILATVFCGLGGLFVQGGDVSAEAEEVFTSQNNVEFTYDKAVSDTYFPERKGLLLSTGVDGARLQFKNVYAGKFEVELAPVSTSAEEVDFSKVAFDIYDQAGVSRVLRVELTQDEAGQNITANAYFDATKSDKKATIVLSESIIKVGFDSEAMRLYVIGGEKRTETTLLSLAHGNVVGFKTVNDLPKIDEFTVQMSFSEIKDDKKAQVVLYSVNGQELDGELENDKGAEIVRTQLFAGVQDYVYTVNPKDVVTCDAFDGVAEFSGTLSVQDPDGESVTVEGLSFTPDKEGVYALTLQAKDKSGVFGQPKTVYVYMQEDYTAARFDSEFPIENAVVGVGTKVAVYPVKANSVYGGALDVTATVKKGEETVCVFENVQTVQYFKAEAEGEYTVVYSAVDNLNQTNELSYSVTVDSFAGVDVDTLPHVCVKNSSLIVPSATTASDAKVVASVLFPNGTIVYSPRIALTDVGVYTLRYEVTKGEQVRVYRYYFQVKQTAAELFEVNKDMVVVENSSSPEYMDVRLNGAMLTAGITNATATYKNVINLSEMTQNDLLFEAYITPEIENTEELRRFSVRLTDIHDRDNYVTIEFRPSEWGYQSSTVVEVYYAGIKNGKNAMVGSSRYGKYPAFSDGTYQYTSGFSSTFRLYWDNESKQMYINKSEQIVKIVDLDDSNDVGVNVFKGFTTGEVEMSFVFDEPLQRAHLLVSNIAGQSLAGEYIEQTVDPQIYLNWVENDYPIAQVGNQYELFSAYGLDRLDGVLPVSAAVYQLGANGERTRILVKDNAFIPTKKGEYEICYQTKNSSGTVSRKSVFITAKEESEIEALEIVTDFEYSTQSLQGESLQLLPVTTTGGSGYATVTLSVSLNGEKLYELSDYEYKTVLFEKVGVYEISYEATDKFVGRFVKKSYTVTVTPPDKPVFVEINMAKAFLKNVQYELPTITAYDYSSGEKKEATIVTKVNGTALKNESVRTMSFSEVGKVNISYEATGADGKTNSIEYDCLVIDPAAKEKPIYLSRYFDYSEDVTVTGSLESLSFVSSSTQTISFINPIAIDVFSTSFGVSEACSNLESIQVVLTDSVNPKEKIVFTISKREGDVSQSNFWINGIEQDPFAGAIGTEGLNGKMLISWNGGTITDAKSTSFKLVNEDGTSFGGFSSGFVYVDYIIVNPNGNEGAGIQVMSIANQNFGSVTKDRIQPNVYFLDDLNLQAEKGVEFVLPKARVYDVLDPNAKLYVMVTKGDEIIVDKTEYYDGMKLTFNDYGKYNVSFIAIDNNNKEEIESPILVKVYNYTAPTLEILGTPKKTIKVGNTIVPLKAETDGTLSIFIVAPDGKIYKDVERFKTTLRGVHRVIYYSCNEYNVSTVKYYEIVVE